MQAIKLQRAFGRSPYSLSTNINVLYQPCNSRSRQQVKAYVVQHYAVNPHSPKGGFANRHQLSKSTMEFYLDEGESILSGGHTKDGDASLQPPACMKTCFSFTCPGPTTRDEQNKKCRKKRKRRPTAFSKSYQSSSVKLW